MNWISVRERLPELDQDVLIFCKPEPVVYPNGIYIAHIDDHDGVSWVDGDYEEMNNVTHWMPLPEPPKV